MFSSPGLNHIKYLVGPGHPKPWGDQVLLVIRFQIHILTGEHQHLISACLRTLPAHCFAVPACQPSPIGGKGGLIKSSHILWCMTHCPFERQILPFPYAAKTNLLSIRSPLPASLLGLRASPPPLFPTTLPPPSPKHHCYLFLSAFDISSYSMKLEPPWASRVTSTEFQILL